MVSPLHLLCIPLSNCILQYTGYTGQILGTTDPITNYIGSELARLSRICPQNMGQAFTLLSQIIMVCCVHQIRLQRITRFTFCREAIFL